MKILMSEMAWWMNDQGVSYDEVIGCVFDRQKEFSEQALNLFDEIVDSQTWAGMRFDSLAFASKRRFPPLQAADALAFDSNLEFTRRLLGASEKPRTSFTVLTTNLDRSTEPSGNLWDKKYMERFIQHQRKHHKPIEINFGQKIRFY